MFENTVVNFVAPALNKIPYLDLSYIFQAEGVDTFIEWMNVAMYLFPFDAVFQIMGIIISLHTFRVVVAFFKALWGIIPIF